jgi:predicted Zn-dependent protease
MDDFFFKLGRKARGGLRKGRWVWSSLAGTEEEALAAELQAGRDLAATFQRDLTITHDPESEEFIASILDRLSARLTNKRRTWQCLLIEEEKPGAFALPGGFLYVTRSLLELCQFEPDAIACIVGHEMAHVVRGHAMERIRGQILTSAATRIARVPSGLLAQWILKGGTTLLFRAYSQNQELDADEFGARLAAAAGYDPRGAIRALARLQQQTDGNGALLEEYFSTHPPLALRIEKLRSLIRVKTG